MTTYLMHHGILGMHWGVRRYQNSDGTLTAEGREHRAKVISKYQNRLNKMDAKATKYLRKRAYTGKQIEQMNGVLKKKGANNVSLGFDKKLVRITNSREKYTDAVKKIDNNIKKTAANILKKGYDITLNDVAVQYRNPGKLTKSQVWGHEYTVTKSRNKKGSLGSYSGVGTWRHDLR